MNERSEARPLIKRSKKTSAIIAAVLMIALLAAVLTACNSAAVTEGTVVYKDFGKPIFSSSGIFDLRMQGDPDYYIKIQSGEVSQWYRVTDINYYNQIVLGQYLICDLTKMKAVNTQFG